LISQVSQVGFPIRKSSDQRVFAPPRRLSQRITSFIACACQGIHQLPLIHLIIHIANIHLFGLQFSPRGQNQTPKDKELDLKRPASRDLSDGAVRQPIICARLSILRDEPTPSTPGQLQRVMDPSRPGSSIGTRTNLLFTMSCRTGKQTEVRSQTLLMNDAPIVPKPPGPKKTLVELSGIEPLTPCLQSRCSPS
jgi:hypothetical protein